MYTVQLRENPKGKVLGTQGPYKTVSAARTAAQPIANAYPGKAVTIVKNAGKKRKKAKKRNTFAHGVTGWSGSVNPPFTVEVIDTVNDKYVQQLRGGNTQAEALAVARKQASKYHATKAGFDRYIVQIVGEYSGHRSAAWTEGAGHGGTWRQNAGKRRTNAPLKAAQAVWDSLDRGVLPAEVDEHAVTELTLYADNEFPLYKQRQAIAANLAKKRAKGTYNWKKAPQGFMSLADSAAKAYTKEFGSRGPHGAYGSFDAPTRAAAAYQWARQEAAGEFRENKGRAPTRRSRRSNGREHYQGHVINEQGGVFIVEPYGQQFRTLAEAKKWLDAHVASSSAYRYNKKNPGTMIPKAFPSKEAAEAANPYPSVWSAVWVGESYARGEGVPYSGWYIAKQPRPYAVGDPNNWYGESAFLYSEGSPGRAATPGYAGFPGDFGRKKNPLRLGKTDKAVIQAFLAHRPASSKKLHTDGTRLDGLWMGGNNIAAWSGHEVVFRDVGSKAAESVQRAVRKAAEQQANAGFPGDFGRKKNPLRLGKTDKAVIQAFLAHRPASSKKLHTDGTRLDGLWMGGNNIAAWSGHEIVFPDLGSKAAESVQRAVRKAAEQQAKYTAGAW
jgi:hypothetical protein